VGEGQLQGEAEHPQVVAQGAAGPCQGRALHLHLHLLLQGCQKARVGGRQAGVATAAHHQAAVAGVAAPGRHPQGALLQGRVLVGGGAQAAAAAAGLPKGAGVQGHQGAYQAAAAGKGSQAQEVAACQGSPGVHQAAPQAGGAWQEVGQGAARGQAHPLLEVLLLLVVAALTGAAARQPHLLLLLLQGVGVAAGVAAAHRPRLLLLPLCPPHQSPHLHLSHTAPHPHPPHHHQPQMVVQVVVAQGVPGRQVVVVAHQGAVRGAARPPVLLLPLWRPAAAVVPADPERPFSWPLQPPSAAAAAPALPAAAGRCMWPLCQHQQACRPSWLPP
jgi:hypothetical protein